MPEDHSSISSQRISPYDVSRASFTVVRRGFEPREVRNFLDLVSRELEGFEAREAELHRAISAAEDQARNPVIDEATLTSSLGQQSAKVLRAAHDEARAVLESAQQQAGEIIAAAQERASSLAVDAEGSAAGRIGDAEIAATNLEEQALEAARKVVAKARADGETLVARAREQGRGMIDQAQEARNRVLADMDVRRRTMHLQIEQLRAARDQLASSILEVRSTIDRLTEEIAGSDEAARAAAQEVARRQPTTIEADAASIAEALGPDAELADDAALLDEGLDLAAPEPGVVEELFAKIRASAHEAPGQDPAARDAPEPGPAASGPDAELLLARDEAIAAARSTLARKVKRSLQDEQNRLLDALRGQAAVGPELLGAEQSQASALAAAAVDPLRDAGEAGRSFAIAHGAPEGPGLSDGAVMATAEQMAAQIVGPLRRRLEQVLASEDPATEVGGAFREWRGSRLDRVVGDAAHEAFSSAVVLVSGDGSLRWVVSGSPSPCPDCADNGLEGPIRAGATFPTGQACPPAHAGCRCAVVPVAT